jgi:asparagine synthase (glutamine-hydrolysing)
MNIVAGIAGLRPYQPDWEAVASVRSALRRYATGPCSTVMRGGVILAVASTFDDAPEPPQPYEGRGGVLLAFDGRMDQVEGHELTAADTDRDTLERISASYAIRRTGCFEQLTGDYGLVIYEQRSDRLVMARDFVGAKHLFYARTKEAIYFASKLTVLLHLAPVSVDPDMHYIAQFFAGTVDTGRSPYREIASVKAGAWISVDLRDGRTEERPYWFAHTVPELRYAKEEEYDEHFRQVFQQSVRRRMRSPRKVLADLSGGLDSSSIVCMADRVSAETGAPRVETWTARYSDSALEDESAYVEAVEEFRGHATHWLCQTTVDTFRTSLISREIAAPCFFHYASGVVSALETFVTSLGAEAQLCGYGGDQVLWNCGPLVCGPVLDALAKGRLVDSVRQAGKVTRLSGQPVVSCLLANWKAWRHYSMARKRHLARVPGPRILSHRFLKKYGGSTMRSGELADQGYKAFATRMQAAFLDEVRSSIHVGLYPEELRSERRFPYLDEDLNEFLLAIPQEIKKVPGETRSLMRRSLHEIIPDSVRTRETKGIVDVTLGRACAALTERPIQGQRSGGEYDFLEPLQWREALDRILHGLEVRPALIVQALVVDLWLTRRHGVVEAMSGSTPA